MRQVKWKCYAVGTFQFRAVIFKKPFFLKVKPYIYMVNKKSDICIFANDLSWQQRKCWRCRFTHWRLAKLLIKQNIYYTAVTVPYLVCSSPRVWDSVACPAEREQSKRVLYRVLICSGIHRWSQHAQQSEKNKDNMASGSQFYSLTTKFKCGLHSFCEKCAVYTKAMICNEVRERDI